VSQALLYPSPTQRLQRPIVRLSHFAPSVISLFLYRLLAQGKVRSKLISDDRYRNLIHLDRPLAEKTFEANKDFYHPICRAIVEKDLYKDK
jgi:Leukotriene A4 hydrolase, C-terminal